MPMPPYPINCYGMNCSREAVYKVASRWSDGVTGELKTYALACPDCLATLFREAIRKSKECRLALGEVLERPGIYHLARGTRDRILPRCENLEKELA